jgi:hypothetical protein
MRSPRPIRRTEPWVEPLLKNATSAKKASEEVKNAPFELERRTQETIAVEGEGHCEIESKNAGCPSRWLKR